MAFVTGLLLIDAPASALNNLGGIPGERTDNTTGVKVIKTQEGYLYPYVSAQSFRYWLRTTLEAGSYDWKAAPIYRDDKIAYTDANPLLWWDDDLFGYMRAQPKRDSAKAKREADASRAGETETTDTITRVSPFRVSTLVALTPTRVTQDFGTMSRHEGDPVPYEHQFYRATLKGLFSLNLGACGTFSYRNKTGFRNLDEVRVKLAQEVPGIEHLEQEKSYRLSHVQRVERIKALFEGMAHLEGGAKQALHYTDVSPALVILAVTRGGNHLFHHTVGANKQGQPEIKTAAIQEALTVFADALLSPIYVGWVRGYLDEERAKFEEFARGYNATARYPIQISHPREAFSALTQAFDNSEYAESWLA
jgi:CRISPR-associated protein Cst2